LRLSTAVKLEALLDVRAVIRMGRLVGPDSADLVPRRA
jgi:hypothetical protein